jgi:hypothetical protein
MSVDDKKELIRAAVQELDSPASVMSCYEAMETLRRALFDDFDDHFVGDDDFKGEIFSARVIQVVITVAKNKEEYPPKFYHRACGILTLLCCDDTELADAFMALGGVAFLLEIMSVDDKKDPKESIRAALQELDSPASVISAYEAMETLRQAVFDDFDDHFVGDDDFKEEIFSARVIQVVITVAKDTEEYPPKFYHCACGILSLLCLDSTELADAFVAHNGVEFLLESLEAFSSDQHLVMTYFSVHTSVVASLNENDSATFAVMMIQKLVDVFELNYETANEKLYCQYCQCVGTSLFHSDVLHEVTKNGYQRIVSHVWHGVMKHKHHEEAQDVGRLLLDDLLGKERAKELFDLAEMHHCEEEECAGCT